MEAEQIYEVLSTAHELGLIAVNHQQVLEDVLVDGEFLMAFDHKQNDSVLRAVALLVELDSKDPKRVGAKLARRFPDYRVHEIGSVERYVSSSGNDTWKAFDEDGDMIYLRQKDKALLVEAGLWDTLNMMPVGAAWGAEIVIHTTQDGDFRKMQMIEEGGTIETPPPDPLPVDGEGEQVKAAESLDQAPIPVQEKMAESLRDALGKVTVQDMVNGTLPEIDPLWELPSNQLNAILWAKGLIDGGGFVVLDTETTDLDGYPIEVAVVSPQGTVLFDRQIKPPEGEKINPKAFKTHGISLDDLKDCPEWGAVASDFADAIKGKTVVIYNADFDSDVVNRANQKYGIPFQLRGAVCAMKSYAEWNGDWNNYRRDYRWVPLTDAARQMGVEINGAHSAKGDALMTLAVIQALAAKATPHPLAPSPLHGEGEQKQ
jgi:DNA polymerase-3 subunit epsilon